MGYVETLFGHQDPVTSIDALRGETAISAGGQDKTVRYWKIIDETQLVFRGGGRSKVRELLEEGVVPDAADEIPEETKKSAKVEGFMEGRIDCVAMLDETTFISGGDSGSLSLWSTTKKKPLFSQSLAHGVEDHVSEYEPSTVRNPRWITSVAALPYSDIFASGTFRSTRACVIVLLILSCIRPLGSWDGTVRLWKLDAAATSLNATSSSPPRSFSHLYDIKIPGVINSIQLVRTPAGALQDHSWLKTTSFATSSPLSHTAPLRGKEQDILLVVGVGQEPRLGRWVTVKEDGARNSTIVYALTRRPVAGAVEALARQGDAMSEDEAEA